MIRYIVYSVALCVVYAVIEYLTSRNVGIKRKDQSAERYVVRAPLALKYVYTTMFFLGVILLVVFSFFMVIGNESVTMGHIRFALVFAGIGLLVMLWASRWSVRVNGSEMEVRKMLQTKKLSLQDIGSLTVGKKGELRLFDKDGEGIVVVDALSDNYELLVNSLIEQGKLKK